MANETWVMREIERRLRYLESLGLVSVGLHASTHVAGGTDPLILSQSQITNLVTDLAAKASTAVFTSVANGLAPLSGGGTTNFLRADGTWAAPGGGGGGSVTMYTTAVDFGSTGVRSKTFDAAVVGVTSGQKVVAQLSANMPAGVALDELEMDPIVVAAHATAVDTVRIIAASTGWLRGQRNINLLVSS